MLPCFCSILVKGDAILHLSSSVWQLMIMKEPHRLWNDQVICLKDDGRF